MKDGNEIEIYYYGSNLDKTHCYGIVCRRRVSEDYGDYWIWWVWYKLGKYLKLKKDMRLFPYNCEWNKDEKLIASYKTVNRGTDLVVPAIQKHYEKIKKQ